MNAALLSSKNMFWCTPQDFFDKLNAEFGFVLDPAATVHGRRRERRRSRALPVDGGYL